MENKSDGSLYKRMNEIEEMKNSIDKLRNRIDRLSMPDYSSLKDEKDKLMKDLTAKLRKLEVLKRPSKIERFNKEQRKAKLRSKYNILF